MHLTAIFNRALNDWSKATGCTATFGWAYNNEGGKCLKVTEINLQLFAKDAPDGETLQELLAKCGTQRVEAETPSPTPPPSV